MIIFNSKIFKSNFSSTTNNNNNLPHLIHNYDNMINLPSINDKNFKVKLNELFNSLDQNSYSLLLFYTYVNNIGPFRRDDAIFSSGIFYCTVVYSSNSLKSLDFWLDYIKQSFINKINYFEESNSFLSSDNIYGFEWINNDEISFVKIFNLGNNPKVTILNNNEFSMSSEEQKLYNNSSKPGFIFTKKIIHPTKALFYSSNGIKQIN